MTGDLRPLAPDLQLLDRRGAKSVAGGEHYALSFSAKASGELADRGGLAGAVDADDEDDEGLLAGVDDERLRDRRKRLFHFRRKHGADLFRGDFLVEPLARERVDDARGGGGAEIGLQQQILKVFKAFARRACAW